MQEGNGAPAARPPWRVTLLVCVLALGVSISVLTRERSDALLLDRRAFWGEPWRLFSARLVHESVWMLGAGLATTLYFGRALERRVGWRRMLLLYAYFALGIGMSEHAFDHGSTGLTCIAYGMWALLVVGAVFDRGLRGVVPVAASVLMLSVFLLGFVVPQVSDWGYAAGIALGALAGLCLDRDGKFRLGFAPLALLLLLLLGQGATRWRRSWNFGGASAEYDRAGLVAFARGDEVLAKSELEKALQFNGHDGQAWWDLGLVLAALGSDEEAAEACWHAYENMTLDPQQRAYLEKVQLWALNQHIANKEPAKAFKFAKNVAKLLPQDLEVWERVRELATEVGDEEWITRAEDECARLGHTQH